MNWTVEYLPEAGGGEWAGGVVGRRPLGRGTAVLILRRKWLHCMGGGHRAFAGFQDWGSQRGATAVIEGASVTVRSMVLRMSVD